jgi:2-polyprenyl-6-methoxyphenol hydroxylase-like FAD-dependent oxidoreductase
MDKRGGRAVVLGASMGGLLAAQVLADFYDRVTMVEQDVLPADPVNRRVVPQGRLIHAALARYTQVLDELFPGFVDELEATGVGCWDDGDFLKVLMSAGGQRITGMLDSPARLLHPSILIRVMRAKRRRRTAVQPVDEGFAGSLAAGFTGTPRAM